MRVYVTKKDIAEGMRGSCQHCPIAIALERRGVDDVRVWPSEISLGCGLEWRVVALPDSAREFVKRFDNGKKVKPFSFTVDL